MAICMWHGIDVGGWDGDGNVDGGDDCSPQMLMSSLSDLVC